MAASAQATAVLGLPYRPELEHLISELADAGTLAFCEFHHEHFVRSDHVRDFADTLANCGIPLHVHSTTLMFGSEIDEHELDELRSATIDFRIETFSGHLASGEDHLPLGEVFDRASYSTAELLLCSDRVSRTRDILGAPVAVENIAYYGAARGDEMSETAFMLELQHRSGCDVIFDISNHLTSVQRAELSADTLRDLRSIRVPYFHVSGGRFVEGRYYDTHADPIPETHLRALAKLVSDLDAATVLYERDAGFDRSVEMEADIRAIIGATTRARLQPRDEL